jgi:hypothetical protein
VDITGGRADKVIHRDDVHTHYQLMQGAGAVTHWHEFNYGHIDVTFAVKEDVRRYLLARLLLLKTRT